MSLHDIAKAIETAKEHYQTAEYTNDFEAQAIVKGNYGKQEEEIAARVIWQSRSCAELITEQTLDERVKAQAYWQQRLGSEEAISYAEYAEAKGTLESEHEFLKPEDLLYMDTLAAIAGNIKFKLKLKPEESISGRLSKIQQEC